MMKKFRLIPALLCGLISTPLLAQPQPYQMPMPGYGYQPRSMPAPVKPKPPSEVEQAGTILKEGLTKLVSFFKQNQAPSGQQIAVFLDREISPYFNFPYMAKWAAGSYYSRMSKPQRKALENELKTQFLSTMAQKLTSFSNQSVRYLPAKITGKGQVQLSIAISNRGGYPARLDFRMYKDKNGWKVYDVSANGSSALMYYRQYFRQKLQRQGLPTRYR